MPVKDVLIQLAPVAPVLEPSFCTPSLLKIQPAPHEDELSAEEYPNVSAYTPLKPTPDKGTVISPLLFTTVTEPEYELSATGVKTMLKDPIPPELVTIGSVTSEESENGPSKFTAVTSRSLPPLLK